MTRFKILDELLSDYYHNYSITDIVEIVSKRLSELYPNSSGVVKRTIEKDLYYIEYEGPFQMEIERYTTNCYDPIKGIHYHKRCLRYAQPSMSIFKKELSDDEQYLLKEYLSLLGQFDGLPQLETVQNIQQLYNNSDKQDRHIISFSRSPLENSHLLGKLFIAISHRQVVKLTYHLFSRPKSSYTITIYPYLLKEYNMRWFLLAGRQPTGAILNFALDRIDHVEPLPSQKYKEYKGDIDMLFSDIIGVTLYQGAPLCNILFWAGNQSKDYIITKPLHHSQRIVSATENRHLRQTYPMLKYGEYFRICCKENYELLRELTSFGKDLIVLEPHNIQKRIIEIVEDMHNTYSIITKNEDNQVKRGDCREETNNMEN